MMTLFGISLVESSDRDGIHLLWTPPYPTGHSVDGFTLRRRRADKSKPRRECFEVDATTFATLHRYGHERLERAELWARKWTRAPEVPSHLIGGWTYRFDLERRYDGIELRAPGAAVAFAARAGDGRIVDVERFIGDQCVLEGSEIERVWISTTKPLTNARICGLVANPDWSKSDVLVEGLQLPFASVNSAVDTVAQEHALASTRLLAGERLDGDFASYSRCMNAALARPYALPAWHVSVAQPTADAKDFDLGALGYGLSLTLLPSWRRALGFGWLDAAANLVAGATYDYRLEASVPQCDRDERRLDFHTVPRGYQLPIVFRIGPVMVCCDRTPVVEALAGPSGGTLVPLHKGVRFRRLTLLFDEPVTSVVLHGESGEVHYEGRLFGVTVGHSGTSRLGERSVLQFSAPITELRLTGEGTFAGLSLDPVPESVDPHHPVAVTACVYGVRFVATSRPAAPTDVSITPFEGRAAHAGFELSWLPPDHLDAAGEGFWPHDADSAPPTQVAWYELERRDGTGGFQRVRDSIVVSTRNAEPADESPWFGFDVLARFPPADRGGRMADVRIRTHDVFDGAGEEIPWGTSFTYRVSAVDAIGRRSDHVEIGPRTLEKHRRPPPPGSPSELRDRDEDAKSAPAGVQIRVIERATADLPAADRALLGAHDAVAVVRWGWGDEERDLDPDVHEFRLYRAALSFREVSIDIEGSAVATADGWQLPCKIDRRLDDNELAGQLVVLGDRAFRILRHGAGPVTPFVFARSSIEHDAVPVGTRFKLVRGGGSGNDPEDWDARVAVTALGDSVDHQAVVPLDGWLQPTATRPVAEGWIGVTAADRAAYVSDRRRAVEAAPRNGNESTVAMARVVRRYRGRPTLEVVPLSVVATLTLPRFEGDQVLHELRPADHGSVPAGRIVLERCSSGPLLRSLVRTTGGVALRRRRAGEARDRIEPWELAASDATRLRAQLEAGPIDDFFLPHIAAVLGPDADRLFVKVAEMPADGRTKDLLPNDPERYVYRIRALDDGGRPSSNAQVLATVFVIPSYAAAPMPELAALEPIQIAGAPGARVRVTHRGAHTDHVLLFHGFDPRVRLPRVELAWIRNRPDLEPERAAIVRDDRGQRLTVTRLHPDGDGIALHELAIPSGHRLHVWALAVSAAGAPSRLVGPHTLTNGVALEP